MNDVRIRVSTQEAGIEWLQANAKIDVSDDTGSFPVFAVAEINPPGPMEIAWLRYESTCSLQRIISHWDAQFYWGVDDDSGVLAVWKRPGSPLRMWVFQVMSPDIERLSPEECVANARRMAGMRVFRYGAVSPLVTGPDMRPPAKTQAEKRQEEWDQLLHSLWGECDSIRQISEERTTRLNQVGVAFEDIDMLEQFRRELVELRCRMFRVWPLPDHRG